MYETNKIYGTGGGAFFVSREILDYSVSFCCATTQEPYIILHVTRWLVVVLRDAHIENVRVWNEKTQLQVTLQKGILHITTIIIVVH